MSLRKILWLGFMPAKSSNSVITPVICYKPLFWNMSCLTMTRYKSQWVPWHWLCCFTQLTSKVCHTYWTRKSEWRLNQQQISLSSTTASFSVFNSLTMWCLALRGLPDSESRGLQSDSWIFHSHSSQTVDFISCRPCHRRLSSAF